MCRIRDVICPPPLFLQVKGPHRVFFRLLTKHISKPHTFYSFCNRSLIKFTYAVTPNLGLILASLNRDEMNIFRLDESSVSEANGDNVNEYNCTRNNFRKVNKALRTGDCRSPQNPPLNRSRFISNVVHKPKAALEN